MEYPDANGKDYRNAVLILLFVLLSILATWYGI